MSLQHLPARAGSDRRSHPAGRALAISQLAGLGLVWAISLPALTIVAALGALVGAARREW